MKRATSGRRKATGSFRNIHAEPAAWTVVVVRKGLHHIKYFSHAVWGGRDLALVAARRCRERLLKRIDPDTRVRRRHPRGRSHSTDVVGVSREEYVVEGLEYCRYVACWQNAEGRMRRRRFSVGRYGETGAKARAVRARQAGVARAHAVRMARQRQEAALRLKLAPPMPSQVKDPLSRKGISMARRRPRRAE
jgi:hypothetical protein